LNPLHGDIEVAGQTIAMNAIVHRYDGLDFIELERITPEGTVISVRAYMSNLEQLRQAVCTRELQ
jgi:hypothetical protein